MRVVGGICCRVATPEKLAAVRHAAVVRGRPLGNASECGPAKGAQLFITKHGGSVSTQECTHTPTCFSGKNVWRLRRQFQHLIVQVVVPQLGAHCHFDKFLVFPLFGEFPPGATRRLLAIAPARRLILRAIRGSPQGKCGQAGFSRPRCPTQMHGVHEDQAATARACEHMRRLHRACPRCAGTGPRATYFFPTEGGMGQCNDVFCFAIIVSECHCDWVRVRLQRRPGRMPI